MVFKAPALPPSNPNVKESARRPFMQSGGLREGAARPRGVKLPLLAHHMNRLLSGGITSHLGAPGTFPKSPPLFAFYYCNNTSSVG